MISSTRLFLLSSSLLSLGTVVGCGGDEPPCDPDAPNTICTIAGTGDQGLSGDNGPATSAKLYIPQDTAVAPDGDLWLLDFNNYMVRSIDSAGIITTRVGTGELADSPAPGQTQIPALDAGFNHTTDLEFHDGYLYLAAWHNSRVKRVDLATMMMENYAGFGVRTKYTGDEGQALVAALDLPSSITFDAAGNCLIMDQANMVVRKVDAAGIITRVAGKCVVDLDVPCATGQEPVQCPDNNNKFVCGPVETECLKPCTPSYGGDGGSALEARLAQPFGQSADPAGRITHDRDGNLVFADTDNNRIRKVDQSGTITTIAGTGAVGASGDGGPATAATLFRPVDVELADDGSIYFTDVYNNCVRKIDTAGIISSVAGMCSPNPDDRGFSGDGGPPLEAKLDRPNGIEVAGSKLYITDSYNNRVRVVNLP